MGDREQINSVRHAEPLPEQVSLPFAQKLEQLVASGLGFHNVPVAVASYHRVLLPKTESVDDTTITAPMTEQSKSELAKRAFRTSLTERITAGFSRHHLDRPSLRKIAFWTGEAIGVACLFIGLFGGLIVGAALQ